MKSTLGLTDKSNIKNFDKSMSNHAIVLTAVGSTVFLLVLIYFIYSKYKKKEISKNDKIKYNGPIREVWSNPDIDNINNIITWGKMEGLCIKQNTLNVLCLNMLHPKSRNQNTSNMIEFN
jgi:hypothetical protein